MIVLETLFLVFQISQFSIPKRSKNLELIRWDVSELYSVYSDVYSDVTIFREKPIAIYMHNSSNGTSRLCSFNRDNPRKVKIVLPSSRFPSKDFFSP